MKKIELQKQLENAIEENRRIKRTLNLALMDLQAARQRDIVFDDKIKPSNHAYDAILRAKEEFERDVTEPGLDGDSSRIDVYIKSSSGIAWNWEEDYKKNGDFAWCGAYAAFCYTKLKQHIRQKIFPSCYRLYNNWSNTSRRSNEVCIGDVITVFTSSKQSPIYGNHIVLASGLVDENGDFETLEGNAKGYGPNGDWREGVSKRTRNIKDVACIYRMIDGDFDE